MSKIHLSSVKWTGNSFKVPQQPNFSFKHHYFLLYYAASLLEGVPPKLGEMGQTTWKLNNQSTFSQNKSPGHRIGSDCKYFEYIHQTGSQKPFFWNFQSIRADLCYILIYKQMLEKAFCSNIAPSLSSGNHLFYKAEYMGQSCPNQVWAITFDWGALAT